MISFWQTPEILQIGKFMYFCVEISQYFCMTYSLMNGIITLYFVRFTSYDINMLTLYMYISCLYTGNLCPLLLTWPKYRCKYQRKYLVLCTIVAYRGQF